MREGEIRACGEGRSLERLGPWLEGWLSGLRHLIRNQTCGQPYRGFDSHPFRHFSSPETLSPFLYRLVCILAINGRHLLIWKRRENDFTAHS